MRVYTICHSFYTLLSRATLFAISSSLISVYTTCHSQQSDQGLHYLPFSAVRSRSTVFAILSLIRVYTICHSQQSDQGLLYLPVSAVWSRSRSTLSFSGTIWSGSTLFSILSSLIRIYTFCHSQQSNQGIHCLPFSAVLSRVYTICNPQQSNQGIHYLPFSAVWSESTLFANLSLIRVYTICHAYQSLACKTAI